MRVPWTARRSNESIVKEINPDYSLEKTLMLGKTEGSRRMSVTDDKIVGWHH